MTKKKTLLEEGAVRSFMKLANLKPLASDFVDKLYEKKQGYDDRLDDTLGAKDGAEKDKEQSLADRRKESEGEEKAHGKGADSSDKEMSEDKDYTAKKEKPGEDKRKGAEKRGAEGTLAKTPGHGKVDYVNEEEESALQEDDKEDDDWGGNKGDESETDPGHLDYEGDEGGEHGDLDVGALVRAIADAVETHTGVSVEVAGEEAEEEADLADEEEVELDDEEEGLGDLEEMIATIAENVTTRLQTLASQKKK